MLQEPAGGSHRRPLRPTSALHRAFPDCPPCRAASKTHLPRSDGAFYMRPQCTDPGVRVDQAPPCSALSRLLLWATGPSGSALPSTHLLGSNTGKGQTAREGTGLAHPCRKDTSHAGSAWQSPGGHQASMSLTNSGAEMQWEGRALSLPLANANVLKGGEVSEQVTPSSVDPLASRSLGRTWALSIGLTFSEQKQQLWAHSPSRTYNLT